MATPPHTYTLVTLSDSPRGRHALSDSHQTNFIAAYHPASLYCKFQRHIFPVRPTGDVGLEVGTAADDIRLPDAFILSVLFKTANHQYINQYFMLSHCKNRFINSVIYLSVCRSVRLTSDLVVNGIIIISFISFSYICLFVP